MRRHVGYDLYPQPIQYPIKKFIIDLARDLRRNQTIQEGLLWQRLRNRKVSGLKFLRQHPFIIGGTEYNPEFFIVDFYCAEKSLVIEVDGRIHDLQKPYDRDRDAVLNEMGLQVLRIKNEDLADMEKVIGSIIQLTHPRPLSTS